ncbi:MAG: aspartate aminotransferase family protein [Planctomycetes bacterium]|nr:aspartate aminotransferase family protein [Planctomycetota bacterium]
MRVVEEARGSGVYALKDVALVRGAGARVQDAEGRWYLDCAAGHGVASLGHCPPRVVAAVQAQAATLLTCAGSYPNDKRAALLERLLAFAGGGFERAFLTNSGTESVEAALKFARHATGRPGIVAATRAFHGRTLGALSATFTRAYREPFAPLVPRVEHARFGDLASFAELVGDETACVIVEAVQGEGGVHVAPPEFLHGLRALCDARGALLVVDEVQTGFGRTGRAFAYEHAGVAPDLVALGKALAGGVPMGAVLMGPRVRALPVGAHGSTFGGNPLACAAALATLDTLEQDGLVERARELGAWLLERLRALESPLVREVRGLGLMVGVDLRRRVAPLLRALQERGVLALPAGPTVLRLLPPLVISRAELEQVLAALAAGLAELEGCADEEAH